MSAVQMPESRTGDAPAASAKAWRSADRSQLSRSSQNPRMSFELRASSFELRASSFGSSPISVLVEGNGRARTARRGWRVTRTLQTGPRGGSIVGFATHRVANSTVERRVQRPLTDLRHIGWRIRHSVPPPKGIVEFRTPAAPGSATAVPRAGSRTSPLTGGSRLHGRSEGISCSGSWRGCARGRWSRRSRTGSVRLARRR
jgi:hypothetical protein